MAKTIRKTGHEPSTGDGLALEVGDAAAVILGNIARLAERTDVKEVSREIKKQTIGLLSILAEWQQAYSEVRMAYERQREDLGDARHRIRQLEETLQSLRKCNVHLRRKVLALDSRAEDSR